MYRCKIKRNKQFVLTVYFHYCILTYFNVKINWFFSHFSSEVKPAFLIIANACLGTLFAKTFTLGRLRRTNNDDRIESIKIMEFETDKFG